MIRAAVQTEHHQHAGLGITAGYIRLTREESILTGLSVPAQRDGINSYAQEHELPNLVIYHEERAIGADVPFQKRPAGKRLIADVIEGRVGHIVCRDLDRLSRDTILWLGFVDLCCQHGVTIHTFSGPLALKSPSDRFASTVRAAAAQLEKDQVADRVKRAKREMAKQGKHLGGPPPFGYTSRARRQGELTASGIPIEQAKAQAEKELSHGLVIDQKEAEVVYLIFDLYVDQLWGCRRIANKLNLLGHRRRSGLLWHPDKVRRIINDPSLTGMVPYDEQRFQAGYGSRAAKFRQTLHQGKHEAIIPLALWRKGQEIKAGNRPTIEKPVVSVKAPLAGILRCRCGAPMTTRGAGTGKSYYYYLCTKRKYYGPASVGGCDCERVNSGRLHAALWSKLSEMVRGDDVVDRVYQVAQRLLGRQQGALGGSGLAADLAKIERDIEIWYTRHDEAAGDAEKEAAWRRIVQLAEKQKALKLQSRKQEKQIRPSKPLTRDQVKAYLGDIAALVAKAGDQGRVFVRSLVEHQGLTVQMLDGQRMRIGLTLLPPVPDAEPMKLETAVDVSTEDNVDFWVREQNAKKPTCACGCGRPLVIHRRHYWRGVPKLHYACRQKGMQGVRAALAGDKYINGTQLAKRLGIGRTTLNRWIRAGKLPKPEKSISGMLLFGRSTAVK